MLSRVLAVLVLVSCSHAVALADARGDEGPAPGNPAFTLNAVDATLPEQGLGLGLSSSEDGRPDLTAAVPTGALTLRASALLAAQSADAPPALSPRARAFEYSDGYRARLKVHKYASFATLPVFVAQFAVGQKLYNGTGSDSTRSLHTALAAATGVLFGVNTVTGVWNLSEGRKDPNHRSKKMLHGILMMAADGGFVATAALAPHLHRRNGPTGISPATHRAIALTSMGVATVGYVMMLFHH